MILALGGGSVIEIDVRRGGCTGNPFVMLMNYLAAGKDLRIVCRRDQVETVKEYLESAGYDYTVTEEGERVVIVARKTSTMVE